MRSYTSNIGLLCAIVPADCRRLSEAKHILYLIFSRCHKRCEKARRMRISHTIPLVQASGAKRYDLNSSAFVSGLAAEGSIRV